MNLEEVENNPNDWDKYWSELPFKRPIILSIARQVMKQISEENISVLEIGCGDGLLSWVMTQQLNATISAVDFSKVAVEKVQERRIDAKQGNISDLLQLFSNREFDYVISSNVLEHLKEDELPDLSRLAKKKIIHVISTNPERKSHVSFYTLKGFVSKFGGEAYYFDVPEWKEKQILGVIKL